MKQHEYDTNVEQSEMNGTGLVAASQLYWLRETLNS